MLTTVVRKFCTRVMEEDREMDWQETMASRVMISRYGFISEY